MDAQEKSDRLMEAASAVLNVAPNRRLKVVILNKALFYLDLAALRDRGETITRNSYIALKNGPVVARYTERLVGQMEARGIGKQVSEWNGAQPIVLESCPTHFRYMDGDAMATVAAVTSYFATKNSRQASDYSHDNPGWQLAWNEFLRTGKPGAIDMHIALQQIVEDDPWMEWPLLNDGEILAAADRGVGDDW